MDMFIATVVLVLAPFGLLFALEREVASEAECAVTFFAGSRNRARTGG